MHRTPWYVRFAIGGAIATLVGVVLWTIAPPTEPRTVSPYHPTNNRSYASISPSSVLSVRSSWTIFFALLPWCVGYAGYVGVRTWREVQLHKAKASVAKAQHPFPQLTHWTHNPSPRYSGTAGVVPSFPPAIEDVTPVPDPLALPGITDMHDVLHSFRPAPSRILLALGEGGTPLTVSVKQLCHIAQAGPTDAGKSNIKRLCLGQLLACGMDAVLADPKFTPLDPTTGEDWRPITNRLRFPPAVTASEIAELLHWANSELDRRLALRRQGTPWGDPLFLSIDELPEVIKQVPEVADILGRLARMGRAVGMFLETAAQDWLAKNTGGDGAVRQNFLTAYYLGGDLRTGSVLLGMPQRQLTGLHLPLGTAMLRSKITPDPQLVRVPLMSNEALYQLLPDGKQATPADIRQAVVDVVGMPASVVAPHKVDGSGNGSGLVVADAGSLPVHGKATNPRAERVRQLLREKRSQNDILAEVWGVTSKGGREWQRVADEYRDIIASLVS